MHQAYKQGRMNSDPTSTWYEGEIKFMDEHVIPLARKLGACGVFGVSGDEYLRKYHTSSLYWPVINYPDFCWQSKFLPIAGYAEANRLEWANTGKEVVAGWVHELEVKSIELDMKDDEAFELDVQPIELDMEEDEAFELRVKPTELDMEAEGDSITS